MSVEAVAPALIVNPKPDTQGNARRDERREEQARHHGKEEGEQADVQPVLNVYGECIGTTINTTA